MNLSSQLCFGCEYSQELSTAQLLRVICCEFVTSTFETHSLSQEVWTGLYGIMIDLSIATSKPKFWPTEVGKLLVAKKSKAMFHKYSTKLLNLLETNRPYWIFYYYYYYYYYFIHHNSTKQNTLTTLYPKMGKGQQKQIHTMIRRSVAPHLGYTIKLI